MAQQVLIIKHTCAPSRKAQTSRCRYRTNQPGSASAVQPKARATAKDAAGILRYGRLDIQSVCRHGHPPHDAILSGAAGVFANHDAYQASPAPTPVMGVPMLPPNLTVRTMMLPRQIFVDPLMLPRVHVVLMRLG